MRFWRIESHKNWSEMGHSLFLCLFVWHRGEFYARLKRFPLDTVFDNCHTSIGIMNPRVPAGTRGNTFKNLGAIARVFLFWRAHHWGNGCFHRRRIPGQGALSGPRQRQNRLREASKADVAAGRTLAGALLPLHAVPEQPANSGREHALWWAPSFHNRTVASP